MSGDSSSVADLEAVYTSIETSHLSNIDNSTSQSPVASLPDVVTAGHVIPSTLYQVQTVSNGTEATNANTGIVQSNSQPEQVSAAGAIYHSHPGSPQRQMSNLTSSESTPSSPHHQLATSVFSQPKGQIGFTIDFDDTGVSWNLKSDLNQFLPNSRKSKMEERRIAVKETPKNYAEESEAFEKADGNDQPHDQNARQSIDKDDLLSEAGTYILDNKVVQKQDENKGYEGNYVDLDNHEITVGQTSLMESFLDHAAASCNASPQKPINDEKWSERSLIINDNRTPVLSDNEVADNYEKSNDELKSLEIDTEIDENKFATFSRSPKREKSKVQSNSALTHSAIPRPANPVRRASIKSPVTVNATANRDSVVISELCPSPQYSPSVDSGSVFSSKLSPVPVRHADSKPICSTKKEQEAEDREMLSPRPNIARRPISAGLNRGGKAGAKIDVDKRLVEMEEILKRKFKVSEGKNLLANYGNETNSSPASSVKDKPGTKGTSNSPGLGNFARLAPIRKSAGPRFAGNKQTTDAKSMSSNNSDVFDTPKKGAPKLGRVTTVPRQAPPPSPGSIRMNKAMQLRMKNRSIADDANDRLSMTSDGTSAKSLSNNKQLSFARANPMYKSLPVKRGTLTAQPASTRGSAANSTSRGLTRPTILPNKSTLGNKGMAQNSPRANVSSAKKTENVRNNKAQSLNVKSPSPDETNLSTFDKLVLSSIDQLSKKLNLSSTQLVSLCQKNDSLLLSGSGNDAPGSKNLGSTERKGAGDAMVSDIPKLKTGCQEISAILYELRVVEKNIEHATRHLNSALSYYVSVEKSSSLENSGNFDDSLVEFF